MLKSGRSTRTIGLEDRSAGFAKSVDNLPPNTEQIVAYVEKIMREKV